jgi:hypothetical protein
MVKPKRKTRRITDSPVLTAVYLRELNREPRTVGHQHRPLTSDQFRLTWERIRETQEYQTANNIPDTAGYETSGHCPHTLGQYLQEALKGK